MRGTWYDGISSQGHEAELTLTQGMIQIIVAGISVKSYLTDQYQVRSMDNSGIGTIEFIDHARFETSEISTFENLFPHKKIPTSKRLLTLSGLLVLFMIGFYFSLPFLGRTLQAVVPNSLITYVSKQSIEIMSMQLSLKKEGIDPKVLEWAAQAEQSLRSDFKHLPLQITVLKSKTKFYNAFALPDGHIVVTEDLLTLLPDTRQRMSILYHEVGHVELHHAMRAILQNAFVSAVISCFSGSSSAASFASNFLSLGYSRSEESEADIFSVQHLKTKGISPTHFADALNALSKTELLSLNIPSFLLSHPNIDERVKAIMLESGN